MKTFLVIPFFVFVLSFGFTALAGTEGHGGGGVECVDPETGVTRIELLDFWVGVTAHGFTIPKTNDLSVNDQLETAYKKLVSAGGDPKQFQDVIKNTLKHTSFVDIDGFPVPHDTGKIDLPPECHLVGIVNYKDNTFGGPTVIVNARVFYELTNTEKAGLWIHEAAYWIFRNYFSELGKDSSEAQRVTAITFSPGVDYKTDVWPAKKE